MSATTATACGVALACVAVLWRRRQNRARSSGTSATPFVEGEELRLSEGAMRDGVAAVIAALKGETTKGDEFSPVDNEMIRWCYGIRAAMKVPIHSQFRVVAVLTVTIRGADGQLRLRHIVGTNHEIGVIGGSICAERTALGKLQLIAYEELIAVHIVTDCDDPVAPGTLCRQYMSEAGTASTRIVCHATNGVLVTSLGELYPFPYLYGGVKRGDILAHAASFAAKAEEAPARLVKEAGPGALLLYEKSLGLVSRDDKDGLHPLRMAGGFLFADGSTCATAQSKALEYGSTVGVCTKLLHCLEMKRDEGIAPQLFLQVDQFGVMHSPLAQGRALLAEHGFSATRCALHEAGGRVVVTSLASMLPHSPEAIETLNED